MKVTGHRGISKFNILEKLNLKSEMASQSTFDMLVWTRELLHSNGNTDATLHEKTRNVNQNKIDIRSNDSDSNLHRSSQSKSTSMNMTSADGTFNLIDKSSDRNNEEIRNKNENGNENENDLSSYSNVNSYSNKKIMKDIFNDDYNDNYNYFNNNNNSVGLVTVREILGSQWLVEELLLETRHARLEIKNTQSQSHSHSHSHSQYK